jgi:hypothetical protein
MVLIPNTRNITSIAVVAVKNDDVVVMVSIFAIYYMPASI